MKKWLLMLCLSIPAWGAAQRTETLMLSGSGFGDTQTWDFWISDGMQARTWTTIEVPSQWELQGFGEYRYAWTLGRRGQTPALMEYGIYRRSFDVPAAWRGRAVEIVFEGVMTDAEVRINGQPAGPVHQGGFYRFKYDITELLRYGRANRIEVTVHKESADRSVNAAERRADWWSFGGIYRPVYLSAKPAEHIERIAVDARADGTLAGQVFTSELPAGYTLAAAVTPAGGGERSAWQVLPVEAGAGQKAIETRFEGVLPWNPEAPNLYLLDLELRDGRGRVVHTHRERIGFRTVEFRPRDGIYVNGVKVVMKGVNRHTFWPEGGRTTNREISLMDARLIKEMNINAVRFHYPPDTHFLDMCDSLGLFVLDELAGWQNSYDTEVGMRVQREFIARDVNHPSVVIWDSGNEAGWNYDLDPYFEELDPQGRHLIHPWADFDGLDTHHYPEYWTGVARFNNGYKVFMPTETMHGSYDEGSGAGLQDFWAKWSSHPLFAGAFIWDLSVNAVYRTDRDGELDPNGNNAVDGILGPHREKEGSYWSIREIWAPIQFDELLITPSFDGRFMVSNTYLYTDLDQCRMEYRVLAVDSPLRGDPASRVLATGAVELPAIGPGERSHARMELPEGFFEGNILELTAYHPNGEAMCTWTWTIQYADQYFATQLPARPAGAASVSDSGGQVTLEAAGVSVTFDGATGLLADVQNARGPISFNGGPVGVTLNNRFTEYTAYESDGDAYFTAHYLGAIDSIQWRMTGGGLLSMRAVTLNRANGGTGFDDAMVMRDILNLGLTFSYPEQNVLGVEWFGKGPYRVWKNRIPGARYGLWDKAYNNTVTGETYGAENYPEFKGHHANLYWMTLRTTESDFTVYSESDGLFARLYTPQEPRYASPRSIPEFPEGDISFLYEIPAIKSFKPIPHHGPRSQPGSIRIKIGDEGIHFNLWFDFR